MQPASVQVAGLHGVAGIALGGAHTLALRQTDDLLAWGANQNGVLGLGVAVSQDARIPTRVPKLSCSQVRTAPFQWFHASQRYAVMYACSQSCLTYTVESYCLRCQAPASVLEVNSGSCKASRHVHCKSRIVARSFPDGSYSCSCRC